MVDSSQGRIASGARVATSIATFSVLVAIALAFVPYLRPTALMRDFSAFYCAGAAIDRHADPYLAEPLGACERAPKPAPLETGIAGLSVPAPLPPFVLVAFAAIARLPYGEAAIVFTGVLCCAFGASILALRRLGIAPLTAVAALALTDGYASLALGQVAPVAIAALLGAAALLETKPALAAPVAALALVEPHLALPALLALAIRRPESRVPLAAVCVVLLAVGVAVVGPATNLEYVRDVLPAHARSEIASTRQFSLTTILAQAGTAPDIALGLGNFSYAVAAAAGIAAGIALSRRFGASMLVLTPMAFAVVLGPFVHVVQMAAVTPLALVLARRQSAHRVTLETAAIALSSPWIQFASLGGILVPLSACAAATLTLASGRPVRWVVLAAVAAVALIAGIDALVTETPADATADLLAHANPTALAEASWTRYVADVGSADRLAYDLARAPTWFGAFAVVAIAVRLARGGKGSAR